LGHALVDLAGVSNSGRLRRETPLDEYCLERAQPCFFLAVWFQRERGEALLSVIIMEHVLQSMVKSGAENSVEAEFLRTGIKGSSLCGDEELPS
jgi:hypothetical protein